MAKNRRRKKAYPDRAPDGLTVLVYAGLYLLLVDHRALALVSRVAEMSG